MRQLAGIYLLGNRMLASRVNCQPSRGIPECTIPRQLVELLQDKACLYVKKITRKRKSKKVKVNVALARNKFCYKVLAN